MITDTTKILNVNVDGIPDYAKCWPYWINWRTEMDNDGKKARKVPTFGSRKLFGRYYDTEGRDFVDALKTMPNRGGLGLVLSMQNKLACIDIDDCSINDRRFKIIKSFAPDAWCEYSPSGNGIHIWGHLPDKASYLLPGRKTIGYRGTDYEWYGSGRYITVTGHRINGNGFVDLTKAIKFIESIRPPKFVEKKCVIFPIAIGIQAILEKAFAREPELARMYYEGHSWEDESREDYHFCQRMWFWLGGHGAGAIEDIFRGSALYREHKGRNYVSITVSNAGKRWNGRYFGDFSR